MKHSKGTRVAAIAATVLVAGLVAAGPASAAPRISAGQLHAGILTAAAAENPDAVLSTQTSGLVSNDPA